MGKVMAKTFLDLGVKVIVFGIHKPEYYSEFYQVDITKEDEIISALSKIQNVDILINNAGVAIVQLLLEATNEAFDEMINVNLRWVLWITKHTAPKLNKGGCIVNISSIAGLKSFEWFGIYSATKAAMISLTKTLAIELANKKIRVNTIAPWAIDTEIWEKMFWEEGKEILKVEGKEVLLKRVWTSEEIAKTAVFLCENEYINGEVIIVDGGMNVQ